MVYSHTNVFAVIITEICNEHAMGLWSSNNYVEDLCELSNGNFFKAWSRRDKTKLQA